MEKQDKSWQVGNRDDSDKKETVVETKSKGAKGGEIVGSCEGNQFRLGRKQWLGFRVTYFSSYFALESAIGK